jgi:ribonucleotide monophosphatase NagD (HAD superfamily)
MKNNNLTIFCDIDGTLIQHEHPIHSSKPEFKAKLLNGVLEKFTQWEKNGYIIILVTARKECQREVTKKQLSECGIFYDQLVMGVGSGKRYLINDRKLDGEDTSFSINLNRNEGIENLKI